MDIEKVVASWPILRRVWRWLPKPMKWVVLAISAVVLWRRWRSSDEPPTPEGVDAALEERAAAGADGASDA